MVAGALLVLSFFGSEAGAALIGASEGTTATLSTAATVITSLGAPTLIATMTYETTNNIIDNSKYQKMIEDNIKATSNNEDIDVSFLNTLKDEKASALTSAMINGFFTSLVIAGGVAQMVKVLGLENEQAALEWYAKISEDMQKNKNLLNIYIKLNAMLRVGMDTQKFDLLIRYAQEAGLTTDQIEAVNPSLVNEDLEFLKQPFSKKGLRLFKDWYNKAVKLTKIEAGQKVINFTLADESSEVWNAELTKFLNKNPDIRTLLAETLGGMSSQDAYAFLEGLSEMTPLKAIEVMTGLKKVSMSEQIINFLKKLKPDLKAMDEYITKIRVFLSSSVNMQPEIVDEEITQKIVGRFPTFCKANNWTNKLALIKKADGTPMTEATLSKYYHIDRDGYIQPNSCMMKQTQCDDVDNDDNYHSVLGPKIAKALKGSNYDQVAEKWVRVPVKSEGDRLFEMKWVKVKMVTRNFSKEAYGKLLDSEKSQGVFKSVKGYFKNEPKELRKFQFYWITRIEPTLHQIGVKDPCIQAWRTIYDCYNFEVDDRIAEIAMRKLIWPPYGYPPEH